MAVPVRDLMAGEVINLETVAAFKIPERYVDSNVLTPSNYEKVKGRRLQYPAVNIARNSASGGSRSAYLDYCGFRP